EDARDWDERLPRMRLHLQHLLVRVAFRGRHHGLPSTRESIADHRHGLDVSLGLRPERADRTGREPDEEAPAIIRLEAEPRVDEGPRGRREGGQERARDLVTAGIHVPDRGPPILASVARQAAPPGKRKLDALLEHEGRTGFEHGDRNDDEPEPDETEP